MAKDLPGEPGMFVSCQFAEIGKLASLPKDPTLDKDLFEQTRFVLGKGAAAAIGGLTCTIADAQIKTHKSVYGQVGSANNGSAGTLTGKSAPLMRSAGGALALRWTSEAPFFTAAARSWLNVRCSMG